MNENLPIIDNTIQYQPSREESVSQMFRLMARPRFYFNMGVIFIFGVVLLTFSASAHRPKWAWILVLFPVLFLIFLRRAAHKIVAQHPEFLELQTVTFGDEGVSFTNSVTRVQWTWQRITKVTETADYITLRSGAYGSGGFIPKRAFTPEQQERFLALARAKAGKRETFTRKN